MAVETRRSFLVGFKGPRFAALLLYERTASDCISQLWTGHFHFRPRSHAFVLFCFHLPAKGVCWLPYSEICFRKSGWSLLEEQDLVSLACFPPRTWSKGVRGEMRPVLQMPAFRMAAEVCSPLPSLLGYKQPSLFHVGVCGGGKRSLAVLLPAWTRGTMFAGAQRWTDPTEALHPSAVTGPVWLTGCHLPRLREDGGEVWRRSLPSWKLTVSENVILILCTQIN